MPRPRPLPVDTAAPRARLRGAPRAAPSVLLLTVVALAGAVAGPSSAGPPGVEVSRQGRVPLLPEGAVLQGAIGSVRFDEVDRVWVFEPRVSAAELSRQFILHPGGARGDLLSALATAEGDRVECEIWGTVFIYRGRNHLLATAANPIEAPPAPIEAPPVIAPIPQPAPQPDAFEEDDLAARLERELEARVGRAPRAFEPVQVEGDVAAPVVSERRWQRRRGHFRRDTAAGMLLFVPEADGTGEREPPLMVLPCRMLERIEAAIAGPTAPRIQRVSGLVIVEGDRRYLLPTAFEVPQEGRGISP
jgi:hypothetical protein